MRVEQLQHTILPFFVRCLRDRRQLRRRLDRGGPVLAGERQVPARRRPRDAHFPLDPAAQNVAFRLDPGPRRFGPRRLQLPPVEERNAHRRGNRIARVGADQRIGASLQPGRHRRAGQAQALRRAPFERPAGLARRERPIVGPLIEGAGQQHLQTLLRRTGRGIVEPAGRRQPVGVGAGREERGEMRLRRRLRDARDRQVRLDVGHLALRPLPVEARSLALPLAHAEQLDETPQLHDAGLDRHRPFLRQQQIGKRQAQRRLEIVQIGVRPRTRRLGRPARRGPEQAGPSAQRKLLRNQQEVVPATRRILARVGHRRVGEQAPFPGIRLHLADPEPESPDRRMLLAHPGYRLRLGQRLRVSRRRAASERHDTADYGHRPQPSPLAHLSVLHPTRTAHSAEMLDGDSCKAVKVAIFRDQRLDPRLPAQRDDLRIEHQVADCIALADRRQKQLVEARAGRQHLEAGRREDTAQRLARFIGRQRIDYPRVRDNAQEFRQTDDRNTPTDPALGQSGQSPVRRRMPTVAAPMGIHEDVRVNRDQPDRPPSPSTRTANRDHRSSRRASDALRR